MLWKVHYPLQIHYLNPHFHMHCELPLLYELPLPYHLPLHHLPLLLLHYSHQMTVHLHLQRTPLLLNLLHLLQRSFLLQQAQLKVCDKRKSPTISFPRSALSSLLPSTTRVRLGVPPSLCSSLLFFLSWC
ncbi:uncharacterized protein G2W53_041756 [Senna tora]|uniref:Uncharacterized protein n=1 Tax=Senna tora TaxID=362788 RepID=A0A834SEA0_9FABA|nr:uncharacterized protein G2W53_041756 [Senna tora]